MTPGQMKRCWEGRKEEETKSFLVFSFGLVCLFVCLLACLLCFVFFGGGCCRCVGRIWRNQEVSRFGVHNVKFSENKQIS